ncbi:MAG: SusD/RagB family nutrient-binding outer membrane lipoprotein, partial [Bacteroidales bacterium]|nr:SusD/RagB family nutrient-binding outer membrane lipoprotein [Candidatus Colimorpha onthohippi]
QTMYNDFTIYSLRPNNTVLFWERAYLCVNNLRYIRKVSGDNSNIGAAAIVLECYTFQTITDMWGNVPYSQAAKLEEGIDHPAYDKQEDIYRSILNELRQAAETFDESKPAIQDGDFIFYGNLNCWRRFANALRLRVAARAAVKDPALAAAVFSEVLSNPDKYPLPEQVDHGAIYDAWDNNTPEPLASNYATRKNDYSVSELMIETLKELRDPRLPIYAEVTQAYASGSSAEPYKGYPTGLRTVALASQVSHIGERFVHKSDLLGISPMLRACEPYFAIAYANSLGIPTPGFDQQSAYVKAVELSLLENGLPSDSVDSYLAHGGKYDGSKSQLFTQWWISVFKHGIEAWSLFRMSGYPQGNHVASGSVYVGHNTPPIAFPYPTTEESLNAKHCAPEAARQIDQLWGKQMWWDVHDTIY